MNENFNDNNMENPSAEENAEQEFVPKTDPQNDPDTEFDFEPQAEPSEMPSDDEFSEDAFVFRESDIDEKIEIPEVLPEDARQGKRGLAVFAVVLSVAILLSGFFAGGYFLGRNSAGSSPLADKPSGSDGGNAAAVYTAAEKSIAGIFVYNSAGAQYSVSGIVYSSDGYIITTDSIYSLITSPSFIVSIGGGFYNATFVGGDQNSDVSVLKISEPVKLTAAQFGDSAKAVTGETVYAIGKSNGYSQPAVIYEGILTASATRVSNSVTGRSNEVLQSSTAANFGDFGGAVLNAHGQVIGMLSTKVVAESYDSITYSTPSATVKKIADQIIKNGKVTDRPRLGISYIFKDFAAAKLEGLPSVGLEIQSVDRESELYEVLKEKDIITHVNNIPASSDDVLLDIIDASKPGDSLTLTVISTDGSRANHTVKLLESDSVSSYNLPELNGDPNLPSDSFEGF